MTRKETKEILDDLHDRFNRPEFIDNDPISVPHHYSKKEDIEIAGFLSAILAWGKRSQIILKANELMELMDNSPADYVMNATSNELKRLNGFNYRTFQSVDADFFIRALQYIYLNLGGLEAIFNKSILNNSSLKDGLIHLYNIFLSVPHQHRSMKHMANVLKDSSAKRLNMFLRWMVRKDNRGVDFGIWNKIPSSALYLPLDVHTGRIARQLKLISRKQNNWMSVEEVTSKLSLFDSVDPVKYDFALFGAGISGIL